MSGAQRTVGQGKSTHALRLEIRPLFFGFRSSDLFSPTVPRWPWTPQSKSAPFELSIPPGAGRTETLFVLTLFGPFCKRMADAAITHEIERKATLAERSRPMLCEPWGLMT